MQQLKFELYGSIKFFDSSNKVLECFMIANDSFIPENFTVMNSDDEIFQLPIIFKLVLDDVSHNKEIPYKQGYTCLLAKFNDDGIIVKNTSQEKISPETESFGILKSVILCLDSFKYYEIIDKKNHLKGVRLFLADDSYEQADNALFFNNITGDIISFEFIFESYSDLQKKIIGLQNENSRLKAREFKRQEEDDDSFLSKFRKFLGL